MIILAQTALSKRAVNSKNRMQYSSKPLDGIVDFCDINEGSICEDFL